MSAENGMIYDVGDRPPRMKNLVFALQQFLAIIAATLLVPILADASGVYLSQSAALIGAGVGTITYLLFTKFKSPVFLGSSFAFITPLATAVAFGYLGIIFGAVCAGLVYVVLAIIIYKVGTGWIDKYLPAIVIGPTVALIGFTLSGSAIGNLGNNSNNYVALIVGVVTFFIVAYVSVKSKKLKMYPFIIGAVVGYAIAVILTLIGDATSVEVLKLVDFSPFEKISDFGNWLPNITIIGAFTEGTKMFNSVGDLVTLFVAFAPIAFVVFAEHLADHKNISSIIKSDLIKDPGLHRTLLGDGVGSIMGAFMGGCPNTTYGESIGCVALSKNASSWTILTAAVLCIVVAFFYPLVALVATIPGCVVGGLCIALYGYIAVSGLRMLSGVDLNEPRNLYVVACIFVCGIGGLSLSFSFDFGTIAITQIACALIMGVITNQLLKDRSSKENTQTE